MRRILVILSVWLTLSMLVSCSGSDGNGDGKDKKEKKVQAEDNVDSAIRLVRSSIKYKRWFARYLRRFVKKDAEFAYWQGKKMWDNTYLVEFGHRYPDDEEVFALSYLVDTQLNTYIRVTGSRAYKDDLKSTLQGKFDSSKEKGSVNKAIKIAKDVYPGRGARYFRKTAKYKKTQQRYWKAKKIRSHVFIVSITSYPKDSSDALKHLCPKKEQKQKEECNPKEKVLPGWYYYVNTKMKRKDYGGDIEQGQAKNITNNRYFRDMLQAGKLFPELFKPQTKK